MFKKYSYAVVIFIRIVLAPFILIWPTVLIIVSFLLDVIDADFAHYSVSKKQYQDIDKVLDYWVYIFAMIIAWKIFPDYRLLLLALLIWRGIGMMIYFKTNNRKVLIIFANYFENIFFVLYFAKIIPSLNFIIKNKNTLYGFFVAAVGAKLFQEWFIHVADLSVRENIFKSKRQWKT